MKITKETIIRTVLLAAALINLVLNAMGKNTLPFTNEEISEAISVVFAVATSIIAWWKNNSFTPAAISGDELMNSLKIGGEGDDLMYYNQNNYSNVKYDNPNTSKVETISSSGCGVAAACIVFNTLAGKELYSVKAMADLSLRNGARDNSGTNMLTLLKALCRDNKAFTYKTTNSIDELKKHLKNGGMAIANQGDCYNVFSTAGHYIVPWKMNGSNIQVVDPQMYSGKYDAYSRPSRIVSKTDTGAIVSPAQLDKACSDRNPRYYLITYTPPKTAQKPVYNAGSKYKLTAAVNVWTQPTTSSQIKKVKDLTANGRANATSKNLNANAVLKAGTIVYAQAVSTDTAGNIWLKIPSGFIPVYYKGKKRANWYNK